MQPSNRSTLTHIVTVLKPIKAIRCTCNVHLRYDDNEALYRSAVGHAALSGLHSLSLHRSTKIEQAARDATEIILALIRDRTATANIFYLDGTYLNQLTAIFANDLSRGWIVTRDMLAYCIDSIKYPKPREVTAVIHDRGIGVGV